MAENSPQTQRKVGFAVLLALACAVVLAQAVSGRRHDDDGIDRGIQALEAAAHGPRDDREEHLARAEHLFAASTGTLVVEPQAIVGLELVEKMDGALGRPDPQAPALATLDDQQAATHAQALLARGKPDAALAYLAQPDVRTRTGRGLAVIARFAERWLAVRSKTQAP